MHFKKLTTDIRNSHFIPTVSDTEICLHKQSLNDIHISNVPKPVVKLVDCFNPRQRLPTAVVYFQGRVRLMNVIFNEDVNLSECSKRSDMLCALKSALMNTDSNAKVYCLGAKGIQVDEASGHTRYMIGGKNIVALCSGIDDTIQGANISTSFHVDNEPVTVFSHLDIEESSLITLAQRMVSAYHPATA